MLLLIHLKKLDYICKHSYLESGVDTEAPGCWIHTGYILSVVYFFKGQFLSVKPTHREECGVNTLQAFALWHQPCLSKKATCYHYLTLNNKHPKMSQGTRGALCLPNGGSSHYFIFNISFMSSSTLTNKNEQIFKLMHPILVVIVYSRRRVSNSWPGDHFRLVLRC